MWGIIAPQPGGTMGQEISSTGFEEADFQNFSDQLARETALLRDHHASGRLSTDGPRIGLELEAWLIDRNSWPAPHNQSFLHRLGDPFVVPELSRFNIEVNAEPAELAGDGLRELEEHLDATWKRCVANAHEDVDTVIAIGTLPTLRESDLSLDNMTPSNRYAALNHRADPAAREPAAPDRYRQPSRGLAAPQKPSISTACSKPRPPRSSCTCRFRRKTWRAISTPR